MLVNTGGGSLTPFWRLLEYNKMLTMEDVHVGAHYGHMEVLTLTTSYQMYNLYEEALTREASKELKRAEA